MILAWNLVLASKKYSAVADINCGGKVINKGNLVSHVGEALYREVTSFEEVLAPHLPVHTLHLLQKSVEHPPKDSSKEHTSFLRNIITESKYKK